MTQLMIEAHDLSKRYGPHTALQKASFEVKKGEVLGFLGPNGAGKTTTMKILTCFIAPTDGTAKVNGHDVFANPMGVRAAIGYLPETTPLYPEMTVFEYLGWIAEMRTIAGDKARKSIKRAVEQTTLGDVLGKEIRALSKGFRQRVGLAQALIHEPPILILDEPMSGLDPNQASEIRELIKQIGRERTVILSTHNLAEVEMACDRVLIIARGRIVADDTPDTLRSRAGRSVYNVVVTNGKEQRDYREPKSAALAAIFEKIPGVETVRAKGSEGELELEIIPKRDDDLRADIFRAAVEGGLVLLELRRESQNLEQVFRDLTVGAKEAVPARTTKARPAAAAAVEEEEEDEDEDADAEDEADEGGEADDGDEEEEEEADEEEEAKGRRSGSEEDR